MVPSRIQGYATVAAIVAILVLANVYQARAQEAEAPPPPLPPAEAVEPEPIELQEPDGVGPLSRVAYSCLRRLAPRPPAAAVVSPTLPSSQLPPAAPVQAPVPPKQQPVEAPPPPPAQPVVTTTTTTTTQQTTTSAPVAQAVQQPTVELVEVPAGPARRALATLGRRMAELDAPRYKARRPKKVYTVALPPQAAAPAPAAPVVTASPQAPTKGTIRTSQ